MTYFVVLLAILGLVVGSAINAFAFRFGKKDSFTKGRSLCVHCRHELAPRDLIPVFSWVALRGKCRYCKKNISWSYPAIEILTSVSFAMFGYYSEYVVRSPEWGNLFVLGIVLGLIAITMLIFLLLYDAKHQILPNEVVYTLIPLSFFGSWLLFQIPLTNILLGGVVGFGFFALLYLLTQGKGIGMGDIKLGLALGFLLGFPGILFMLFGAYVLGALYAAFLLYTKKKSMQDKVPFGPFLSVGAILTLIFGLNVIEWYASLL